MTAFRSGGWWSSIPAVTKNLLIINIVIWLVESLIPAFDNQLLRHTALHYWGSDWFNPIQILTYMFLHDPSNPLHLLFNMFTLWMFGRILENTWGSRRFMLFYLFCGVGAAVTQELVWTFTWMNEYVSGIASINGMTTSHMSEIVDQALAAGDPNFTQAVAQYKCSMLTVGASGAIFGLLLGFACTFPNLPLYLFFIPIPIKAKYMVLGYGVLEFFLGISGKSSTVAHFAHLGGLIFGLILILIWRYAPNMKNRTRNPNAKRPSIFPRRRKDYSSDNSEDYGSHIGYSKFEDRRRLNELLDKISVSGYASLSSAEREELKRLSDRVK